MCSQSAAGKMDATQQYCLRWRYHHSNLQAMFSQLLDRKCFCDVTLACEGKTLKAHKVMLSACSTYFDSILSQYEESNPVIILKDAKYSDIEALLQFMYKGEINVHNSELTSLLKTAEELKIKGLAEVSWRSERETESADSVEEEFSDEAPEPKKLKIESFSPKSTLHPVSPSLTPRDEYNKSHCDADNEDTYDESDTECSSSQINGEQSRIDGVNFDDSSPSNANSKTAPYTNVQSQHQSISTSTISQTSINAQMVNSSSVAALSVVSDGSCSIRESVPEDDVCSITPEVAIHANSSHSTEPTSGASVDLSQFPDIMKMNEYLESGGRRPQFWEEPFTKRLMEAIKNKELEMKVAAELMGVSYGTLYGRYRDAYGCLKHPYRVRDFWSEQGPAEVLAKLQRKELNLFSAAEVLNVSATTLANYLSMLHTARGGTGSSENEDLFDNEEMAVDDDKISPHHLSSTVYSSIYNKPDITILKKENLINLNGS